MTTDPRVQARRRRLDIIGAIAAAIGIIGILVDRSLLWLWAFLILFGLTTVPERLLAWLRRRRTRND